MQNFKTSIVNIFISIICFFPFSLMATESVKLQLKWTHQFQFAGYYAAQKQGYYNDAGLDVEIVEGNPSDDSTQIVLQGKAGKTKKINVNFNKNKK